MNRRDLFKRTAALGLLASTPSIALAAVPLEPDPEEAILAYVDSQIVDLYAADLLTIPAGVEDPYRMLYLTRLHGETHAAGKVLRFIYFDEHVYQQANGGVYVAGSTQARFIAAMVVWRRVSGDHYTKSRNGRCGLLPTPLGARMA